MPFWGSMFDLGSALSPILEMLESVSFSAVLLASGVFPVGDGADLLTGLGVKVLIALDLRWIWPRLPLDGPDSSDSSPGSEGRALAILASTRSKITEWFCRLSGSEKFADSFGVLEAGGRGRYPPLLRVFIGPRRFCFFSLPRTHATSAIYFIKCMDIFHSIKHSRIGGLREFEEAKRSKKDAVR